MRPRKYRPPCSPTDPPFHSKIHRRFLKECRVLNSRSVFGVHSGLVVETRMFSPYCCIPAPHNPSSGLISSTEKLSFRLSRSTMSGKRPSSYRTSRDPGTSRHVSGHHSSIEFNSKVPCQNEDGGYKWSNWMRPQNASDFAQNRWQNQLNFQ